MLNFFNVGSSILNLTKRIGFYTGMFMLVFSQECSPLFGKMQCSQKWLFWSFYSSDIGNSWSEVLWKCNTFYRKSYRSRKYSDKEIFFAGQNNMHLQLHRSTTFDNLFEISFLSNNIHKLKQTKIRACSKSEMLKRFLRLYLNII